jgi:hypothetical protein
VIHQGGIQPVLGVHNNGDILRVRTELSVVLDVCLLILVKIFSSEKKMILFGLAGFLLVCTDFITDSRVDYSTCRHGFENKDRFLTLCNKRDAKLPNECLYTFI